VIVDLPNNQVGVDIRQQGQTWWSSSQVDAARRPAPPLDVSDFGTPVQTVTTARRATACAW
jgi:type IV pilus assembly protein PilQ